MRKPLFVLTVVILNCILFGLTSCLPEDHETRPKPTKGAWKIYQYMTVVGDVKEDGSFKRTKPESYIKGDFGYLDFFDDSVNYNISHYLLDIKGNEPWKMAAQLDSSGTETGYTLTIGEHIFNVENDDIDKSSPTLLKDGAMLLYDKVFFDDRTKEHVMLGFVANKR